jgi:DNA-binding beta-propeller fold protein YncE
MLTRSFGLLAVTLALLASTAPAQAAPGDVVGQSCISKTGSEGCALLAEPNVLGAAAGVVVAPDGSDVYVGAAAGIAHFRRAADGSLTYANCVDTSVAGSCPTTAPPDAGGALSANSINLAISPDGKHVYAVSWVDALLWWTRDPTTGNLTWGGCRDAASDSSTNGRCGTATTFGGGNFPAGSMAFAQGISVTPDGQTIYIADQSEGLLQAQRNTSTGAATPTSCFNTTGGAAAGCTSLASGIPMALSGIDVASNSRDVYVRSISPGGVTHFSRTAGGTTSFTSCVGSSPAPPLPRRRSSPTRVRSPSPATCSSPTAGTTGLRAEQRHASVATPTAR